MNNAGILNRILSNNKQPTAKHDQMNGNVENGVKEEGEGDDDNDREGGDDDDNNKKKKKKKKA